MSNESGKKPRGPLQPQSYYFFIGTMVGLLVLIGYRIAGHKINPSLMAGIILACFFIAVGDFYRKSASQPVTKGKKATIVIFESLAGISLFVLPAVQWFQDDENFMLFSDVSTIGAALIVVAVVFMVRTEK